MYACTQRELFIPSGMHSCVLKPLKNLQCMEAMESKEENPSTRQGNGNGKTLTRASLLSCYSHWHCLRETWCNSMQYGSVYRALLSHRSNGGVGVAESLRPVDPRSNPLWNQTPPPTSSPNLSFSFFSSFLSPSLKKNIRY